MLDLAKLDLAGMTLLSGSLRRLGSGAASMEDAAERATRYLYEQLVDRDGNAACALIRFFKSHAYARLPGELQAFARESVPGVTLWPHLRCLTLLASAGMRPHWNSRRHSNDHKAIPLIDETVIESAPMLASLVDQLGMQPKQLVEPNPGVFLAERSTSFNVFHIARAEGSALVPAQDDFVIPCGIRSVIGFGGALPNGEMYAMILFSRVTLDSHAATLFKPISLSMKLAVTAHDNRVFT